MIYSNGTSPNRNVNLFTPDAVFSVVLRVFRCTPCHSILRSNTRIRCHHRSKYWYFSIHEFGKNAESITKTRGVTRYRRRRCFGCQSNEHPFLINEKLLFVLLILHCRLSKPTSINRAILYSSQLDVSTQVI